jgi:hypothetical protein
VRINVEKRKLHHFTQLLEFIEKHNGVIYVENEKDLEA